MAIMYAASLAINLAVTAIDNYIHRTEKLIEAGEKAQNAIKEVYDTYSFYKNKNTVLITLN